MKAFFKAEDFEMKHYGDPTASYAADVANAKLNAEIEKWLVFLGRFHEGGYSHDEKRPSHRARRAFLEEIPPCEHEPEDLKPFGLYRCRHCKVSLKAKWEAV